MKKILFALIAVAFVSSLCFAQQASVPETKTVSSPAVIKTFTGKVELVKLADPVKKTKSEIIVVDDKGQSLSKVVSSSTAIYDKAGQQISLDKIMKGDKVTIEYSSNGKKAKSIKLVE